MTVSSTASKISYVGNGVTTIFSFPYYFLVNADLVVLIRSAAGVETTQIIATNYTVSGAANPLGGTVTMLVAPAAGETLVIYRDPAVTQGTDYVANDDLPAEVLEINFDRLTMIAQRLKEVDTRSLKFPETDPSSLSAVYPSSVDRASKVAAFAADGSPTTLSIAGLGVTVDSTSLVVVSAVAPGHVTGRLWVDTSTVNTLIIKQSDGTDWVEFWRIDTISNALTLPTLVTTPSLVFAGASDATFVTPFQLAVLWSEGTDIVAAASISLPATGGGYFHITGSTGINGISGTGIRAGYPVKFVFDAAPLLTNSATLILQGGVNFQAAANDTISFVHEGSGTWREVGRTLAGSLFGKFNSLTTDDTLTGNADFVPYYDAGEGANNKVTLQRLSNRGFLSSQDAANSAEIIIDLASFYNEYQHLKIFGSGIAPGTDAVNLQFQVSTDGGATYDAGAADYGYTNDILSSGAIAQIDNAHTHILMTGSTSTLGNVAGETMHFKMFIPHPQNTGLHPQFSWNAGWRNSTPHVVTGRGFGQRFAAQDTTHIKFTMTSGNILIGKFQLEGIRD